MAIRILFESFLKTKSAAILQLSNDFYDPADVTMEYFHLDKKFEWEEKADCQVGHEGAPDSERFYKIYKTESCEKEINTPPPKVETEVPCNDTLKSDIENQNLKLQ